MIGFLKTGTKTLRVLVTRIQKAAEKTARALHESDHEPVLLPLFELVDTANPAPVGSYDGYVFTSGNAIEILKLRGWTTPDTNCVAYCVGDETALAAKTLGFSSVSSANGNAQDLANLIGERLHCKPAKLLYFAGIRRSSDLSAALNNPSITLDLAEIYKIERVFPNRESKRSAP